MRTIKKRKKKDTKDTKDGSKLNSVKPSSELSLKLTKVDEKFLKKSNKNLRHNELDKSFVKKCSFNSPLSSSFKTRLKIEIFIFTKINFSQFS